MTQPLADWVGAGRAEPARGEARGSYGRIYRAAGFAPWDEVVSEIEWEGMAEREAWWKLWSGSMPSQREWYAKRRELVDDHVRAELWNMDKFG